MERGSPRGLQAVSYTREEGHSSCVMHQRRELQAVSCTRVEEGSRGGLLALPCTRGACRLCPAPGSGHEGGSELYPTWGRLLVPTDL